MKQRKALRSFLITLAVFSAMAIQVVPHDQWNVSEVFGQGKTEKTKHAAEKRFALNFKDVEVSEFIMAMSELIGKNIVIDDKIKGKITVNSPRKIPVSQAFDILKSILEVKGFAIVETPNIIKIIPINEALKKNYDVIIDGKDGKLSKDKEDTITYLLKIKNSDATEIATSLKELKSQNTQIVTHRSINTLILSGMESEIYSLLKIARALDEGAIGPEPEKMIPKGNVHVVHLENANAEELANVLSRIPFSDTMKIDTSPLNPVLPKSEKGKSLTKTQTPQPGSSQKLSIVPSKETNSIIITAKPDEFKEIHRIIMELDVVREQVLIEALIVEINLESGWGFGIDWMLGDQQGSHIFGGSSIQGGVPDYSTPSWLSTAKKIAVPLATGFQLGYLADTSILGFALLNASMTNNNYKILSTPQVLTIDNQEAELNVAEEIAVPTNTRISDTGTTFQTFDYKQVGIKLKIKPHITKKHKITMDLYQEVNNVIGETTITSSGTVIPPKLGKRDIKTKVTVLDGKTIVVGGLIRNNKSEEESKTPLLGDIPLLGWFFKHKTVSYTKSNLLVFITPHIVTRQDRIDAITKQKIKMQQIIRKE